MGKAKPIQLGLQGGGAHGALAWGVLDRLLEEERLEIRSVSGTSAGAMNAVVLADGLAAGGREGARAALARFWRAVAAAGALSPFRRGLWDRLVGRHSLDHSAGYLLFDALGRVLSPREINPLGINPLRPLLQDLDFERLNRPEAIELHVAATNVRTGLARVFSRGEISIDAVLASACLPQLHAAVEIDGECYWDGGFSANPALMPLVEAPAAPDLVIVALNPLQRQAPPAGARGIINRTNEITFNAALLNQLATIRALKRQAAQMGCDTPAAGVRLHLIEGAPAADALAASSKFDVEWASLSMLHARGRQSADAWLGENRDAIGRTETLDLDLLFGDHPLPPRPDRPRPAGRPWRSLWRWLQPARPAGG